MRITMVRHGQTNENYNRIIQGRKNNPLNQVGRQEARDLGKIFALEHRKFDHIVSSQLSRALETAFILSLSIAHNKPIIICHKLTERNFGDLEEKPFDDAISLIEQEKNLVSGYETDDEIMDRVTSCIRKLYTMYPKEHLLIVAHSHVIKAVLVQMDPHTYSFAKHRLKNTEVFEFEVDEHLTTFIKK